MARPGRTREFQREQVAERRDELRTLLDGAARLLATGPTDVEAVMVHDVPRGNDDAEELALTNEPIELDIDLRTYFRRKIMISLKERGVDVVADENEDNTVRAAAARMITRPDDLASASRTIAERLDEVQTGRNPAPAPDTSSLPSTAMRATSRSRCEGALHCALPSSPRPTFLRSNPCR
jgi:hypothetical protein